ncbi:hypothetical protein ACVJBD_000187 [Rhizobium mongolense]
MRGRLASIGAEESLLSEGWNLILTEPGACAVPHDIPLSAQFTPAPVPGTVAAALEKAGLFDRKNPGAAEHAGCLVSLPAFRCRARRRDPAFRRTGDTLPCLPERPGNPLFREHVYGA